MCSSIWLRPRQQPEWILYHVPKNSRVCRCEIKDGHQVGPGDFKSRSMLQPVILNTWSCACTAIKLMGMRDATVVEPSNKGIDRAAIFARYDPYWFNGADISRDPWYGLRNGIEVVLCDSSTVTVVLNRVRLAL
jgi:hypothetical protein